MWINFDLAMINLLFILFSFMNWKIVQNKLNLD